ncbi:MAG: ATP-binding cassette domain-containing protein, partial [Puniceicoccales bacterium]|nr:ATP-binding cassette domain-containing protein [Puniceicoccales bacterium]
GKTSFLHILGGILAPTGGRVLWDGRAIAASGRHTLRGKTVSFVFQKHCFLPELTVLENVLLPWRIAGAGSLRAARVRVRELLSFAGLSNRENYAPNNLSGGELQRAAVARALLLRPKFLLADEPTGSLDNGAEICVRDLLLSLCRSEGTGLLVVSHGNAFDRSVDRVIILKNGEIEDEKGNGGCEISS